MANLRPFRDYDEKDVINLFALDTTGLTIDTYDNRIKKGTLVKASDTGWNSGQELDMPEAAGDFTVAGVTSQRYHVKAKVEIAGVNSMPLGMMLFDVANHDENGELLKFNPRKASELEAVLPGQAVPIVSHGIFLYESASLGAETFNAGAALTVAANGELTSTGITLGAGNDPAVATALGAGWTSSSLSTAAGDLVLIQLHCHGVML